MKNLILIALAFYIWHINRAPKTPQQEIEYSWSGGAGGSGTTTANPAPATTTPTTPDPSTAPTLNYDGKPTGGRGAGYFSKIPPRRLVY
jgi:hypothetical protein